MNDAISQRIHDFMAQRLGMDDALIETLRKRYVAEYGATMRGLALDYGVEPEDYLEYVHRLPVEQYIQPNDKLDSSLMALPWQNVIFTSATREHTRVVLAALGVGHHFARVFDIRDVGYVGKPADSAFRTVLAAIRAEPEECVFFDDAPANVQAASRLGMGAVLVGTHEGASDVDLHVVKIEDALGLFGRLYEAHSEQVAEKTSRWESS